MDISSELDFANKKSNHFKSKADHNKRESLFCFILVIVCSLGNPIFVTLGEGLFWGKILPSILSLSVAASTAWLQLRKPQMLWALYRDCQRRIEDHVYKFEYHLDEYDTDEVNRSKLLVNATRNIAMDAHQKWLPLIPTPDIIGERTTNISPLKNEKSSLCLNYQK